MSVGVGIWFLNGCTGRRRARGGWSRLCKAFGIERFLELLVRELAVPSDWEVLGTRLHEVVVKQLPRLCLVVRRRQRVDILWRPATADVLWIIEVVGLSRNLVFQLPRLAIRIKIKSRPCCCGLNAIDKNHLRAKPRNTDKLWRSLVDSLHQVSCNRHQRVV